MKISTKLIIIFSILLGIFIFLCIYPNNNVKAITQSQAAQAIANFALNVANNHAAETHYVKPDSYHRPNAYKGIKTYSVDGKIVFGFDCNGFVSFVVHNALGIGGDSFYKFVYPSGSKWVANGPYFYEVASGLSLNTALSIAKVGDIICSNGDGSTHTQIYVGNREIVDCAGYYPNAVQIRGENRTRNIRHSAGNFTVLRISEQTAASITNVNSWVNQIGVVNPDIRSYYDQNYQIIVRNQDGTYQYEDGRLITYQDGNYIDENGNIIEINSSVIVVDEATGQTIGTIASSLQQEQFQGILRIQRASFEEEQAPRDLKYISLEELKQMATNNDIAAVDHYSMDGESLVVAKSTETIVYKNEEQTSYQSTIDLVNIEYKTIVAKYSMPFEFQLALQTITRNPEFVVDLCSFQRNGEIVLMLQDYTVTDTTICETETTTITKKYAPKQQIAQQQTAQQQTTQQVQLELKSINEDIGYDVEETIIKTQNPVLNIKSADTWIYKVENEYTSAYSRQDGQPQSNTTENTNRQEHQDGSVTQTDTTTTTTTTNIIEKTVWNQGPSNKQSKEETILPLFSESYDVPNQENDDSAGDMLKSGAEMLFSLLESNEKTQEHSKIMRYLLYRYNQEVYGSQRDYGVKTLDLNSLDENFYTVDDSTTYDTSYTVFNETLSYSSFVGSAGSTEGRAVATVAEYFVRVGSAKNLLIYSEDSNKHKGFRNELSSGKTEERVQEITYENKLVYDAPTFVSAMYNSVLGIPSTAWATETFTSYKDEPIDGTRTYFYYLGEYNEVKNQLEPGDILVAEASSGNKSNHVMLYLGEGRMVHASSSNDLEVSNVWSTTSYVLRLKPNLNTSINMKLSWPDDGVSETVVLTPGGSSGGSSIGSSSSYQGSTSIDSSLISMDEVELFERVVASEARGEPYEGQVAVAAVVLNRLEITHRNKTTLRGVLLDSNQFASPYGGEITQSVKQAVQEAFSGADPTITNLMPNGAIYFNKMSKESTWYTSRCGNKVYVIGDHVFYREFKPWRN